MLAARSGLLPTRTFYSFRARYLSDNVSSDLEESRVGTGPPNLE
jgi:hypothetical protein